ncbi:MAG: helix-turn-helix domain-containing protein, partial [Halothiobacillaceae bacterium]
ISGSIYERWYKVYGDLLTIARHHGGLIPEGHRDVWLFLAAVALSWFTRAEALAAEIDNAARTFTTLTGAEVRKVVRTIQERAELAAQGQVVEWAGQKVDPRYRFRRSTLYAWLRGLIPDALLPELRAIIPDALARERKLVNDRERYWDGREAAYTGDGVRVSNEQKRAMARLMRAQGMSQRAIAAELGVSQQAVQKWLKGGDN